MHLAIDAVGVRAETGGAIVLADLVRAAAEHAQVERTTVFVSPEAKLALPLRAGQQSVAVPAANRMALLWWNATGLSQRAEALGADAILSLNGLGHSARLPLFMLFQQQLMFAPRARELMSRAFRWRLALLRRLSIEACRKAALVFAQAEHVRENLSRQFHLAPERLSVILPDISWTESASRPAPSREPGLVVYVGSCRPYKSLGTLVQAVRLAGAALDPFRLQLTVEPGCVPTESGVQALGRLDRAAVRELLSRAEMMVMPSLAETVGLPLLEAMDLGCPIVAANLPYAREAARDAALYFEPGDAAGCAARLRCLRGDASLRAELAARGRNLLQERRVATPYARLLDQLVVRSS